jgi:predicted nucleotidyltransferase
MKDKLNHLPHKSRSAIIGFTESLIEVFGDDLYSVFLFGSAARAALRGKTSEFKEGASDINLTIILEKVTTRELNIILNSAGKFKKRGLAIPLIFRRGHIPSSLDTFPLEFSEMKQHHIVLYGADPLADAVIETKNLRYQCEVEFKGQLVQLRRGYLAAGEDREALTGLLSASVSSIMAACKGMAMLKGKTSSESVTELLKQVQVDYSIDTGAIDEALKLKHDEAEGSTATLEGLFDRYMGAIEKLANVVDEM